MWWWPWKKKKTPEPELLPIVDTEEPERDPVPCCVCYRLLDPVDSHDGWKYMQPIGGGEVRLYFSYGSAFDQMPMAEYKGLVCDSCADEMMPALEFVENEFD